MAGRQKGITLDEAGTVTEDAVRRRSRNMSMIRGKDTGPEKIVRKHLFACGFRYRKNDGRLPGRPDIVLPKYRTVIFVNGCFWHRHEGCAKAYVPASHIDFWMNKFARTVERDRRSQDRLKELGWRVIIVWECELVRKRRAATLAQIVRSLTAACPSAS